MNTSTGMLVSPATFNAMPADEKKNYVEVQRPLTVREHHKMKINMYAPCGCGSGKKFKFCCHRKPTAAVA